MKLNKNDEVKEIQVEMEGTKDVKKKVLIGPDDGSNNIFMRLFTIAPGGNTPWHSHNFEHIVKIEKGKGNIITDNGKFELAVGNSLFVKPNEMHQFVNPYSEDFQFICVIPNPEKNEAKKI